MLPLKGSILFGLNIGLNGERILKKLHIGKQYP